MAVVWVDFTHAKALQASRASFSYILYITSDYSLSELVILVGEFVVGWSRT
jgi:hypothetical protein